MSTHILRMGLFVVAGIFLCAGAASRAERAVEGAKKPAQEVDLREHPTRGATPVEVSVGLYLTNLVSIDETRESFEAGGYLVAKWKDPRLALPADGKAGGSSAGAAPRTLKVDQVWTPPIEAANSISHKTNTYQMEVDASGAVTYTERFDAILSNEYFLRKFPFDKQALRFEFEPFMSASTNIMFAPEPLPVTGIRPGRNTELASWRLDDLRYLTEGVPGHSVIPSGRAAMFEITISRRPAFYVWKIFLPLMMICLIPAVVFWIDAKEFDWILKIPMTMLLSMVAFELAITRDLPRVGYVTFLDAVFVTGFVFCFLCVLEILAVFLMYKRGAQMRAARIHASGRWLYPLSYFGMVALLALLFLT